MVGSVFRQLGQTLKVLLTVVTGEDGLVVQVLVSFSLLSVLVLFLTVVGAGSCRFLGLALSVGRRDFWEFIKDKNNTNQKQNNGNEVDHV